ncbi:PA0069 family radical SAM protein [Pseudomonadota bacterium]
MSDESVTPRPHKGRGATQNPSGRFESTHRFQIDDGWDANEDTENSAKLTTQLHVDSSRSIIARNQSPDVPFSQSINPYRGCEHGCVYCFARPSHNYLGYSIGLDFETQIHYKKNAAELLIKELARPGYRCSTIALGVNADAYQPVEKNLQVTRSILKVLENTKHPVVIITKSTGILRDLDILSSMAENKLVKVMASITTLDNDLSRTMEPRAATPNKRLATLGKLSDAGIHTGILSSPMIPGLNDHELESILEAAVNSGAKEAEFTLLRLPYQLKELFENWLHVNYPLKVKKVLNRIRDCRGGNLYQNDFGTRMKGTGLYADLLNQRFCKACTRLGLNRRDLQLNTSLFQPPTKPPQQMELF